MRNGGVVDRANPKKQAGELVRCARCKAPLGLPGTMPAIRVEGEGLVHRKCPTGARRK